MAREVTIYAGISAAKNGATIASFNSSLIGGSANIVYDMSGANVGGDPQDISNAADSAVTMPGGVTNIGVLVIKNVDPTNYVELSTGTGGTFAANVFDRIKPGMVSILHPTTNAVNAKANTATVKIMKYIAEGALTPSA